MARWINGGRAFSGGRRRSSSASTSRWSCSKKAGSFIRARRSALLFALRLKRLSGHFAACLAQQDFDASLGLLELLLAVPGELHAFFEKLHGFFEWKIGAFQFAHDLFQARQRLFEGLLFRRLRLGRFRLFAWSRIHAHLPARIAAF